MTSLLTLITPTNLEAERVKFFASSTYNPIFHYLWQDDPGMDMAQRDPLKQELFEAVLSQDHSLISQVAQSYFDTQITPTILKLARDRGALSGIKTSGSAQHFAELLREGLDYFGLTDTKIVLSSQAGFNARPDHSHHQIIVSQHAHFEYFSMEGGVRHDLVHTIRHHNGQYNHLSRAANYLPTEEGLASWCQDHTNDDNGEAQHAMEYVGSSIGLSGSLRDIYNYMIDSGMTRELAWKRASRHKFGFIDTGKPGDIIKPAMYFANEVKIGQLSSAEKLRLFVGKIALTDLPAHPVYSGRWPAKKLVDYFNL